MRNPPPPTVFDRPQWKMGPDPLGLRKYGNVSNRLEITQGRRVYAVALAVPTDLFTYLRTVVEAPVDAEVTLSMDFVDGYFVFSMLVAEGEDKANLIDFWHYKTLPSWMTDQEYRVR